MTEVDESTLDGPDLAAKVEALLLCRSRRCTTTDREATTVSGTDSILVISTRTPSSVPRRVANCIRVN